MYFFNYTIKDPKKKETKDKYKAKNIEKKGNAQQNDMQNNDLNINNAKDKDVKEEKKNQISKNKKEKLIQSSQTDSEATNKSMKDDIKGDIDFLIPDLKPEDLKKVLNKKELAPFVFYGNIDWDKNSDLIGEVKESISTGDKDHIRQFEKYLKILDYCNKDDKTCQTMGLKKGNQKILVYIIDSNYKDYLYRMLSYDSLFKQFKELNDSQNARNFSELYCKIYKKDESKKKSNDFIERIIKSDTPYMFIFVQDILTSFSKLENKEIEVQAIEESRKIKEEEKKDDKREEKKDDKKYDKREEKKDKKEELSNINKEINALVKEMREMRKETKYLFFIIIFLFIILIILFIILIISIQLK